MPAESPEALVERYLHEHIPLCAAMGVRVEHATAAHVRLSAPLGPNINHRDTVFGGSSASLATLAAWTLLHLRLSREHPSARAVIQRSRMEYERPIPGNFEACCQFSDEAGWRRFRAMLARHHRARIALRADLLYGNERAGSFEGEFVAIESVG